MSKLLIIATIFCFTSLSVHGQDVVKTNQTDSLDISVCMRTYQK